MSTLITCPQCAHQFEPSEAMSKSIEADMRTKMTKEWNKKLETLNDEKKQLELQTQQLAQQKEQQEADMKKRVDEACKARETEIESALKEKITGTYAAQMQAMEEAQKEKNGQLLEARQKEIELHKKLQEMDDLKSKMELDKQRELREARQELELKIKEQEQERSKEKEQEYQFKTRELEKKLEDQHKLVEEMKRKAEQGSMQLQGEVQELALEDLLRQAFPFDKIAEVGKGVMGGDCVLTVRNSLGQECGCILFESKRTKDFNAEWITKLKKDMAPCNAEIAIIVTQAMPKEVDRFGEHKGVYVCGFGEVKSLVSILRVAVIKVHEAKRSQENKGDKMELLYTYLTGAEFQRQWQNMRENFVSFKAMLEKERNDFEKNWKKKEKMLEQIIHNSLQISGSVEGIAGMEMNLIEGGGEVES